MGHRAQASGRRGKARLEPGSAEPFNRGSGAKDSHGLIVAAVQRKQEYRTQHDLRTVT